jgi:hypothetical protein
MKNVLIVFAALIILGGAFAEYFSWLRLQPRPDVVHAKTPLPSQHHAGGALGDRGSSGAAAAG